MATLYLTEYQSISVGNVQVPLEPPIANQTVTIGSSSAASNPFSPTTTLVRVHADSICSVVFGKTPVATAANARWAANQTEYHGVAPGLSAAVITNT